MALQGSEIDTAFLLSEEVTACTTASPSRKRKAVSAAPLKDGKKRKTTLILEDIAEIATEVFDFSSNAVYGKTIKIPEKKIGPHKKETRPNTVEELASTLRNIQQLISLNRSTIDTLIQHNLDLRRFALAQLPLPAHYLEARNRVQHLADYVFKKFPQLGITIDCEKATNNCPSSFNNALRFVSKDYNEACDDGTTLKVESLINSQIPGQIDCEWIDANGTLLWLMELKVVTLRNIGQNSKNIDRWLGQCTRATQSGVPVVTLVLTFCDEDNYNFKEAAEKKFNPLGGRCCSQVKPQAC